MAVINVFGAESKIPGSALSVEFAAAADPDVYPIKVVTPLVLTAGGPTRICVTAANAAGSILLPLASAATDGLEYTFRNVDVTVDAIAIKDSTDATTYGSLATDGSWLTIICENRTPAGTGVAAYGWVVTASTPIIAT